MLERKIFQVKECILNDKLDAYKRERERERESLLNIDNFEVVAESHGRVQRIGNPFFLMTDPRGNLPVD